jgi:membrane glycosyltransferase
MNTAVLLMAVSSNQVLLIICQSVNECFYKIRAVWGGNSRDGTARIVGSAAVCQLSIGICSELAVSSCCTLVGIQLLILFVPIVQAVTLLRLLLSQGGAVSMVCVT